MYGWLKNCGSSIVLRILSAKRVTALELTEKFFWLKKICEIELLEFLSALECVHPFSWTINFRGSSSFISESWFLYVYESVVDH